MEEFSVLNTTQSAGDDDQIDAVSAGLSLAVLVVMATIGNAVLLFAVSFAMRTLWRQMDSWRVGHCLIFVFGCLELLFVLLPCLMTVCAYLSIWRLDEHQSVCHLYGWVVFWLKFGTLWILTLISCEKYIIVCRSHNLSKRLAERLAYTAACGLLISAVLAAVPLMGDANTELSVAVPGSFCHFNFTPRTTCPPP